jgi:hypothetical protein
MRDDEDLEWLEQRIAELQELEKESTGVEPAFCQRMRAEEFAKRLEYLYGIHLGALDIMTALIHTGVKLSIDSLGHVQSGYDSLKYSVIGEEVVDLKKYKISRRLEL